MDTKFKTRINAKPAKGEVQNNRDLLTRPDGVKSLSEILNRFSQGIPLTGRNNPIYNESWEHPDLDHLDLVEVQELKDEYARSVNVKRKALLEKYSKEQKDEQERKERELEERIAQEFQSGKRGGNKKSTGDVSE